jgi:hypothetical protein
MPEQITIEDFRTRSPLWLVALEKAGFERSPELEETSSMTASLVYAGEHVAFVFSLDFRDQCVDAEVVKVRNGKLFHNWDGGYSSNVFGHLVKHERYRGGANGANWEARSNASMGSLEEAIKGWLNLLETAGENLLRDSPDSLPR